VKNPIHLSLSLSLSLQKAYGEADVSTKWIRALGFFNDDEERRWRDKGFFDGDDEVIRASPLYSLIFSSVLFLDNVELC